MCACLFKIISSALVSVNHNNNNIFLNHILNYKKKRAIFNTSTHTHKHTNKDENIMILVFCLKVCIRIQVKNKIKCDHFFFKDLVVFSFL